MNRDRTMPEELTAELNRNRELLREYISIGPGGRFGAMAIREDILAGEAAMETHDPVAMITALKTLRENE